ncbi:MAG: hypothetical protein HYY04_01280 [Chloroflexi bacterium]|nr:hypothetical protein [Chloroflexota bacterium]
MPTAAPRIVAIPKRLALPTPATTAWLPWLAAGALIRLLLMPTTMHNDTVWMPWMAHKIVEGHWNVYQHLLDTYGDRVLRPVVWAPYMPLYYLVTAAWTGFLRVLGIVDVGQWTFQPQWEIPGFHRSIFLVKALYLPFDLAIGWALGRLVPADRRSLVWALWGLSPVTLVSAYMMGQNDLMATSFVVLATLAGTQAMLANRGDTTKTHPWSDLAAVLLGLGAAFKSYPLFLVLPFGFLLCPRKRDLARFVALGAAPFVVAIVPFLPSAAFRLGVLLNPEAQRIFAGIPGVGPAGISPFIAGYVALLTVLAYRRSATRPAPIPLPVIAFLVVGLMLGASNWPFYWMVWLTPFVVWSVATSPLTYGNALGYAALFLFWTWGWGTRASSGLFLPVFPGALSVPPVIGLLNTLYPWERLTVVMQSSLVGLLVCQAVGLLREKWENARPPHPVLAVLPFHALLVAWILISFLPAFIRF